MQKLLSAGKVIGATALLIGIGAGAGYQRVKAQRVRVPLLIQTEIQHRSRDPGKQGTMETSMYLTEAIRSDGSWVQDTLVPSLGGSRGPSRIVALVPSRQFLHYNSRLNVRTTRSIGDRLYARYIGTVPNDCLAAHPGPGTATCTATNDSVLGYRVMKLTRSFYPNGDGTESRTEELVAPSLDWRTLSYAIYRNNILTETRKAIYIVEGEPASGLFSVPDTARPISGDEFSKSLH
jgi:hypothetical protein